MAKTIDTRGRGGRSRTLNGRRYRLHDVYDDRQQALREAEELRKGGRYYAQVEMRGKWVVWKRFRQLGENRNGYRAY